MWLKYSVVTASLLVSSLALADQSSTDLRIDKMDCPSCPFMIKQALERVDGVQSASVSMETKVASVAYDNEKVTVAELVKTTTELGFPATEVAD